ncbi:MAG: hydroxymethylglutaryl-CoA lyase [Flavobacteriales bacterium]
MQNKVKVIECPRDAMQGIKEFIPTEVKMNYINLLLKANFDTLDMGSFVSPKAIPQLSDTAELIKKLDLTDTDTKLLTIVANERGAQEAANFDEITYLGFPFSVSETFQQRNINSSISDSFRRLAEVQNICAKYNKKLVVYLSMAFGNPYGDDWSPYIVAHWAEKMLKELDVKILSLSDTIGSSTPEVINYLFGKLIPAFPEVEIGAHLHTTPDSWKEKVEAAYMSGCRRFDSAIKGYGGCPMAKDELTGNMPTENVIGYFSEINVNHGVNQYAFNKAMQEASLLFPKYAH